MLLCRCVEGYYADLIGSTECLICPAGFECPDRGTSPQSCPVGTYALSGHTRCQQCPIGHGCNSTDSLPNPCPIGWYSAEGTSTCTPCPRGYFCPSAAPVNSPIICPVGHYNLIEGGTFCNVCPGGHQCPNRTEPPESCPAGYFSPTGLNYCSQVSLRHN